MVRKVLPNGLEVVVKENHQNQSVGFFCFVKTGSANEGKYLGTGISHHLEHLIAGGTTKFHTEAEFKKMYQQSGSISNAYTNTKATVYHIITHRDFAEQTLSNLAEQLQHCALDSFEVARENAVIQKEIVMGSTNPADRIPERRDELFYQISNQKFPIIGYVELFKKLTRRDLVEYYRRHYVPNNMIFVAVGSFNADSMLTAIEKKFADMPRGIVYPETQPAEPPRNGSLTVKENYDITLPKAYLCYVMPQLSARENFALFTALSLLFDKRESPISFKLNEELKMVNEVWAYNEAADNLTRENTVMVGLEARDGQDPDKIIPVIDSELQKAVQKSFTQAQINALIDRLERERIIRVSDIDTEANEIGWNMLNYGIADYHSVKISALKQLSPADLQQALQNLLKQGRLVYQALPAKQSLNSASTAALKKENRPEVIKISNRLTLIHKQNDSRPVISGALFLPWGSDYETILSVGEIETLNRMVVRGSLKYQPLWLSGWLEDHLADLRVETYGYGTLFKFKCLKKDYQDLEKIIIDLLKNPSFREDELALLKDEIEAEYQNSRNNPEVLHEEYLSSILYPGKRRAVPAAEINQHLQKMTTADFKTLYQKNFRAVQVRAAFIGDLTRTEAENSLKRLAAALPDSKIDNTMTAENPEEIAGSFETRYPFEQVYLTINYPAPQITEPDFKIMLAIQNLLNGNLGLIFEAARGRNDLAYSAYSYFGYAKGKAYLRIDTQTTLEKKDQLLKELLAVMDNLRNGKITQEEIDAGIADWQRSYLNDMLDDYWPANYLRNAELDLGYDFVDNYKTFVGKITPADVERVAKKYFGKAAVVASLPDESIQRIVK